MEQSSPSLQGGCRGGPARPLFHQAGGRERAGDDGADIDAGALLRRGRSRLAGVPDKLMLALQRAFKDQLQEGK